jgi:hypothetical protein
MSLSVALFMSHSGGAGRSSTGTVHSDRANCDEQTRLHRAAISQLEYSIQSYRSEAKKGMALADIKIAEALEARDKLRTSNSHSLERLAQMQSKAEQFQSALAEQQQSCEQQLQSESDRLNQQLQLLRDTQLQTDQQHAQLQLQLQQPAATCPPPTPPIDVASESTKQTRDLCRVVGLPAYQTVTRIDVTKLDASSSNRDGIAFIQHMYLDQSLFAPNLPRVVPNNLRTTSETHFWSTQQQLLQNQRSLFAREYAVLKLTDFCIAGRGDVFATAWDSTRVLDGQLFRAAIPTDSECINLDRVCIERENEREREGERERERARARMC